MKIHLNGEPQNVDDHCTISDLLANLELTNKRLAVEINEELVTRSEFEQHQIKEGDQVEIVQAIGGG